MIERFPNERYLTVTASSTTVLQARPLCLRSSSRIQSTQSIQSRKSTTIRRRHMLSKLSQRFCTLGPRIQSSTEIGYHQSYLVEYVHTTLSLQIDYEADFLFKVMNIICYTSLAIWDIPEGWRWACYILSGAGYGLSGLCMAYVSLSHRTSFTDTA